MTKRATLPQRGNMSNRDREIKLRVTAEEFERCQRLARGRELTVSGMIRLMLKREAEAAAKAEKKAGRG